MTALLAQPRAVAPCLVVHGPRSRQSIHKHPLQETEVALCLAAGISAASYQTHREQFGHRGKFALLEEASGIAATRWKNLFYAKQAATDEQLQYWINSFEEDEVWLLTGAGDHSGFPFGTLIESALGRGHHWTGAQLGHRGLRFTKG